MYQQTYTLQNHSLITTDSKILNHSLKPINSYILNHSHILTHTHSYNLYYSVVTKIKYAFAHSHILNELLTHTNSYIINHSHVPTNSYKLNIPLLYDQSLSCNHNSILSHTLIETLLFTCTHILSQSLIHYQSIINTYTHTHLCVIFLLYIHLIEK